MNNNEILQISRKTKHIFLQKLAYSKTTASKIVFGSPELGFIGLLDLHTEQGPLNMQLLERALQDSQMLGNITRIALQHWQWQLDTGNNPFHSKYSYPHDESKWLK